MNWIGGALTVALPLGSDEPSEETVVETLPGGEVLRVTRVDDVLLSGIDLVLSGRGPREPIVRVQTASADLRVRDDAFRLDALAGPVLWEDGELSVQATTLELPGTRGSGEIFYGAVDGSGRALRLDLELEAFDLADLEPLAGEMEDVTGSGTVSVVVDGGLSVLSFRDARVNWEGGTVSGDGLVRFPAGDPLFGATSLTLARVPVGPLAGLVDRELPVNGLLTGGITFEGPLSDLEVLGRLDFDSPDAGGVVRASMNGQLDAGSPLSSDDGITIGLDPFYFELVGAFEPRFRFTGPGRVELRAFGSLEDGLLVDAEVTHRPVFHDSSILRGGASIRPTSDDGLMLDITGPIAIEQLSLDAVRAAYPTVPIQGRIDGGQVTGRGELSAFRFEADLLTAGGPLAVEGVADLRDPSAGYEVSGSVEELALSNLLVGLPEPTVVTGDFELSGSGFSSDDVDGRATVALTSAEVGRVTFGASSVIARADAGMLHIDSGSITSELGSLTGTGALALAQGAPPGEMVVEFTADAPEALRSLLYGDSLLTRDGLDDLERARLEFEQIDPDTLPSSEEFRIGGSATGRAVLRGSVQAFAAEVTGTVLDPAYHANEAAVLSGTVTMSGLPTWPPSLLVEARADSLVLEGRSFMAADLAGSWEDGAGIYDLLLDRSSSERYSSEGALELDSAGGRLDVDRLVLDQAQGRWTLAEPTTLTWGNRGITVEDFLLTGDEGAGMSVRGQGSVPVDGEADLRIEVQEFPLARVSHLLQLPDTVRGVASGSVSVGGTAEDPAIRAEFRAGSLEFGEFAVDAMSATMEYDDRSALINVRSSTGDRTVLTVDGTLPLDLRFRRVPARVLEEPMDLTVDVDSLPMSLPMAYFDNLDEPEGTLTGQARIRGTPQTPAPEGVFQLSQGGVRVEALGVRYRGIEGTLTLLPDGVLGVDLSQAVDGRAAVQGEVVFDTGESALEVFDPAFDLEISGTRFLAVNRRDLTARISGAVALTGRYRTPQVEGAVTVVGGQLSTAELQRLAEVVDPTDPAYFDLAFDTTFSGLRFVDLQPSPFLQSLRANVEIELQREFTLVSPEVNVNLEGTLAANWDRRERDLSLRGALTTVRGTYTTLEKVFQVQSGTVQFVGIPGIDPVLNIQAVNRVRLPDRAPLNIIAQLDGTLQNPRVRLSTDAEGGISEADLISYLLFGRPTYQLTQGQNAQVTGVASSFFGAGASIGLGAFATRLGAAAAREFGLDYFAVTQQQGTALDSDFLGSTVASTVFELGLYLQQDLFVSFRLRPLVSVGTVRQSEFAGATAELRLADTWTLELFWEDRFTRGGLTGFGTGGVQLDKQGGFFLFKTWGY